MLHIFQFYRAYISNLCTVNKIFMHGSVNVNRAYRNTKPCINFLSASIVNFFSTNRVKTLCPLGEIKPKNRD